MHIEYANNSPTSLNFPSAISVNKSARGSYPYHVPPSDDQLCLSLPLKNKKTLQTHFSAYNLLIWNMLHDICA